ncbi:MAG: ferredoxin [Casimicrobiaceae bacterium]
MNETQQSGNTEGDGQAAAPKSFEVRIYPDRCISAGHCVVAAEDIFGQNDADGVVMLLEDNPPLTRYAAVKEAARKCPTSAIEIIETW